jgi:hypothetical protein
MGRTPLLFFPLRFLNVGGPTASSANRCVSADLLTLTGGNCDLPYNKSVFQSAGFRTTAANQQAQAEQLRDGTTARLTRVGAARHRSRPRLPPMVYLRDPFGRRMTVATITTTLPYISNETWDQPPRNLNHHSLMHTHPVWPHVSDPIAFSAPDRQRLLLCHANRETPSRNATRPPLMARPRASRLRSHTEHS